MRCCGHSQNRLLRNQREKDQGGKVTGLWRMDGNGVGMEEDWGSVGWGEGSFALEVDMEMQK